MGTKMQYIWLLGRLAMIIVPVPLNVGLIALKNNGKNL